MKANKTETTENTTTFISYVIKEYFLSCLLYNRQVP